MRPSKVIYDRAHSAIAEADAADFDFDAIMEGADWFHWSGITPAISDKAAELTRLACEAAKRHGVTVSVDLNFRKKLWTKEKARYAPEQQPRLSLTLSHSQRSFPSGYLLSSSPTPCRYFRRIPGLWKSRSSSGLSLLSVHRSRRAYRYFPSRLRPHRRPSLRQEDSPSDSRYMLIFFPPSSMPPRF